MNDWATACSDVQVLSLEEMRELPEPQEYDAGIYFLWKGDALTYIGKSKHICERLYFQSCMNRNLPFYTGHRAKLVPFDKVTCLVLETGITCSPGLGGKLMHYERAYIAAYQPGFNQDNHNGFT
jgi:hypothetical protein